MRYFRPDGWVARCAASSLAEMALVPSMSKSRMVARSGVPLGCGHRKQPEAHSARSASAALVREEVTGRRIMTQRRRGARPFAGARPGRPVLGLTARWARDSGLEQEAQVLFLPPLGALVLGVLALAAAELGAVHHPPAVLLHDRDHLVQHLVEDDRRHVVLRDLRPVEGGVDADESGVLHVDAGLDGVPPPPPPVRAPADARVDEPAEVHRIEAGADGLEVVGA